MANNHDQVQKLVTTLLVPLLDKLDTGSPAIRTKIISLLGQINKKLKGYLEVQLPIASLLESTLSSNSTSAYSQSFKLMYVTMAVERAGDLDLKSAIPCLLDGIQNRPTQQIKILVPALLTAIQRCSRFTDEQLKELGFKQHPNRADILLSYLMDVLLYNASTATQGNSTTVGAGLSASSQAMITNEGKASWAGDRESLKELKLNITRIVASELAFPTEMNAGIHEKRFTSLLCGGCDPYFPQVASLCEDAVKRISLIDYESVSLIDNMFSMILGAQSDTSINETTRQSPVAPAIRLKLFGYLNRSQTATGRFPQWLRTIFEGLFGTTTTSKIRRQGLLFMQRAIQLAPIDQLNCSATVLLQGIRKIITETSSAAGTIDSDTMCGLAYIAWGALIKKVPSLVTAELDHLQTMFDAFNQESANVRLSIQEGLLIMLPAYDSTKLGERTKGKLLSFLKQQLRSSVRQARHCSLRYIASAFPFACMEARWLCMLGLADSEREVRELARSGLTITPSMLVTKQGASQQHLPELVEMINFLHAQIASPDLSNNIAVYVGMVEFSRSLMLAWGMSDLKQQQRLAVDLGTLDVDALGESRELSTELQLNSMKRALVNVSQNKLIDAWATVSGLALNTQVLAESPKALGISLMCLTELMSLGPLDVALTFFDNRQQFIDLLAKRNPQIQLHAARSLAIVFAVKLMDDMKPGSNGSSSSIQAVETIHEMVARAKEQEHPRLLDTIQGSILGLGYIHYGLHIARRSIDGSKSWTDLGQGSLDSALVHIMELLLNKLKQIKSIHSTIVLALLSGLGELSKAGFGQVSLADEIMSAIMDITKPGGTDAKLQDAAFTAMANIVLGNAFLAPRFIEFLHSSAKSVTKKQLDAHFKIGESLAMAIGRFTCTLTKVDWMFPFDATIIYNEIDLDAHEEAIDMLLELVTSKMIRSPQPQERQAAVVWILSLVQFCPGLVHLESWLPKLHTCLCGLLADRDEFTQEAASKTIGLIYDMGNALLKEDLVYSLMGMFGGKPKNPRKTTAGGNEDIVNAQESLRHRIQSDEPLLEQDSLGQTPDGHSVNSTYKSILSLASDVQNPSLVYQFMQLASNAAIWSSRRGAAYGFASIIERARDSMRPYMASIIPKLYRYTFDPSPQTRAAMTSIWRALLGPTEDSESSNEVGDEAAEHQGRRVKSGTSVLESHWEAIMDECLASMGQNVWRVRESGCSALAGAVRGVDLELVVPYLERIWQMSFRALDDIKGSVRESGLKTCQSLGNTTVAWCTPRVPAERERDRRAQAVMDVVMPFLLNKGIGSDAEDVRGFSLGLLLKLCKSSGKYLTAHVPLIVERMLESLSNMESQAANYLSFHAENSNITQEQLETARLSAVKASPIMQGIEMVLEYLSPESMEELVPKFQRIIRRGLGLPTRAGCARAVVMLCVKRENLVRPHASALVKAISGSLTENSAVQRQTWAAAIGYMAPMLGSGMFRNLLRHLEKTYFDRYESDVRGVCGQVLDQLAARTPERLRENINGPGTCSFVLLGSWDDNEPTREAFQNAWQEYRLAKGNKLVEQHLEELLRLPLQYIGGDSWPLRIQSAKAIMDAVKMVGRIGSLSLECRQYLTTKVLPVVGTAVQGRVWSGKEHVVECLVKIATIPSLLSITTAVADAKAGQENNGWDAQAVCDILLKEMTRGDLGYRRSLTTYYCGLMEATHLDVFDKAASVILESIERNVEAQSNNESSMAMQIDGDDYGDERTLRRPQRLMFIAASIKALQLTLPEQRAIGETEVVRSAQVMRDIARAGVWNIRVASLGFLKALFAHCMETKVASQPSLLAAINLEQVVEVAGVCAEEGKYVTVRTAALDMIGAVVVTDLSDMWKQGCWDVLQQLEQDETPSIALRAKELLLLQKKTGRL